MLSSLDRQTRDLILDVVTGFVVAAVVCGAFLVYLWWLDG